MNQGYVHEVFREVATRMPEAVAIECADGPVVTCRALEEESNRLANYLLGVGARKGSVMAVVAEDTVTMSRPSSPASRRAASLCRSTRARRRSGWSRCWPKSRRPSS